MLYARQWVGRNQSDAEDAAQEGFVRFWESRERADDPQAYLYTCVRSAAMDQHRAGRSRNARENLAGEQCQGWFESMADSVGNAIDLQDALATLPADQREVVVLKIWGGLTFAQIADVGGISANTAASRYRYAIEKLEAILSDEVKRE